LRRAFGFVFGAADFAFVVPERVPADLAREVVPAVFERDLLEEAVPVFVWAAAAFVVDFLGADFFVDFAADVDRRRVDDFVVRIGSASPTAFTAALAASPTVSTTLPAVLPAVLPTVPAVLPTVPAVLPTVRPTDFTTLPGSGIGLLLI
jgi:hypothetical protein